MDECFVAIVTDRSGDNEVRSEGEEQPTYGLALKDLEQMLNSTNARDRRKIFGQVEKRFKRNPLI